MFDLAMSDDLAAASTSTTSSACSTTDLLVFDIVVLQHHIDELCLDIVVRVTSPSASADVQLEEPVREVF